MSVLSDLYKLDQENIELRKDFKSLEARVFQLEELLGLESKSKNGTSRNDISKNAISDERPFTYRSTKFSRSASPSSSLSSSSTSRKRFREGTRYKMYLKLDEHGKYLNFRLWNLNTVFGVYGNVEKVDVWNIKKSTNHYGPTEMACINFSDQVALDKCEADASAIYQRYGIHASTTYPSKRVNSSSDRGNDALEDGEILVQSYKVEDED
jgi:hypothetical protein